LGTRPVDVSVDGGVKAGLAKSLAEDGASTLVAGSAVFGAADPAAAVRAIRAAATA
jgi:ribulose-phosphate 3-epimerase